MVSFFSPMVKIAISNATGRIRWSKIVAPLKDLPSVKSTTVTHYDHTNDPCFKQRFSKSEEEQTSVVKTNLVPPYLKRSGFIPRKVEDFGNGAFLEIHVAPYPLDMVETNHQKPGSKILPVTVDDHGNVADDAIVKLNET